MADKKPLLSQLKKKLRSWEEDGIKHGASSANHGASSANQGASSTNHGASSTNQGSSSTNHGASSTNHKEYPAACFKEEPCSDKDIALDLSISKSQVKGEGHHLVGPGSPHVNDSQYLTNPIKEEPCDHEEGLLTPAKQYLGCQFEDRVSGGGIPSSPGVFPCSIPYSSSLCIKEEPCDHEEGLLPPANHYLGSQFEYRVSGGGIPSSPGVFPPPCSSPSSCIKEELESGEDDLEEGVEYTSVCIKEEPISGDEGDVPPIDIGERRIGERLISGVYSDPSGDEESNSDHPEIEYTTDCVKGEEESSDEDYVEVIPYTDHYATRDHTYMVTRTNERMKAPCNTRKLHKTLNCGECGKVLFGKAAYRLHQKLHRGEAVYACSTCGRKFSRKGSCEKHQEAAHSQEKSFECDHCDRHFSSTLGLKLHQRIHTREPAFACKVCAKSFTSNSALIQHQRVHYTRRRLACGKCGKTFANKSDLINHEILHPVRQSFACSECGEKFLTKAELSAHWKVHTVIKAFSWRKIRFTHQETRAAEETAPGAAGGQ